MKRFRSFLQKQRSSGTSANQQQPSQSMDNRSTPQTVETYSQAPLNAAAQSNTLTLALQNQTNSNTVYAYVTGHAIDNGNAWFLLRSDAVTPYYPASPGDIMQPLGADCAIRLGAPGSTVQAQLPHVAGGRIWFSIDQPLTFFLNPGPALVEPSVTNPSDPNAQLNWTFCEMTWNYDQLYANISYVDFVSIPVALTLNTRSGATSHVAGMNPSGLTQVADALRQQHAADGQGWDQLIINRSGTNQVLRVLSPVQGMVGNPNLFSGYYDGYVNQVLGRLRSTTLKIDTQAAAGTVSANASGNILNVAGQQFTQPSTRDVFTCSTGPFQTGSDATRNAIIPRVAAAFNRSTLLLTDTIPAPQNLYYQNSVTNHYSRIVHQANLDGKGYAFPYDDVQPTGGGDQSGEVNAGDPTLFTVAVGGINAYV